MKDFLKEVKKVKKEIWSSEKSQHDFGGRHIKSFKECLDQDKFVYAFHLNQ